jgi:hypothetical protein
MTQVNTISCPHCAAPNAAGAAFCVACGKALPSAAGAGPRVVGYDSIPVTSTGQQVMGDQLRKEMNKASIALLVVAVIQTLLGPVALYMAKSQMEREMGQEVVIQPIGWVMVFGIAAAFFALFFWARVQPLPAAMVGLILFVTIHLLDAVGDPQALVRGIIMKVIVIAVLINAIKAAIRYKKLREGMSPSQGL